MNKKEGETPLEALEAFRNKNKNLKDAKMTYAGRLDPLASGLLLILEGQAIKQKEKYLRLQKEYEFSILFGFSTDTYDILGKVKKEAVNPAYEKSDFEKKIKENLKLFTGKFKQKYPMYSSKTVLGKPLFAYARAGLRVDAPEREVDVKSLNFLKLNKIGAKTLSSNIEHRIAKVGGDFRQKEILKIWQKYLKKSKDNFFVASFHIKCTSGTYVRSIAHGLGESMAVPALALSIKRTKIGNWRQVE